MQYLYSIIILALLIPLAYAGLSMAPWVPTRGKDISRLIQLLSLQKGDIFFEIGCGDGRVSQSVAQAFPTSNVVAYEIAYPFFCIAYMRKLFTNLTNYKIYLKNAFKEDFGKYDIIYVYGMPDKMVSKIVPKFMNEAKVGAKLYSYVFSIPKEYAKNVVSHGAKNEAKIHILEKK